MSEPGLNYELTRDGATVSCTVSGALSKGAGGELYQALAPHLRRGRQVSLDLVGVTEADAVGSSGLAALVDLGDQSKGSLSISAASAAVAEQLDLMPAERTLPAGDDVGMLEAMGAFIESAWRKTVFMLAFMADAAFGCVNGLFSNRSRRRGALWRDALAIGTDALPVVATISFLLGLILAFQGGHLFRNYGGSIFVADLVGVGMLREFAPLMTAIVVSGRSGAAIAAEIGAMKNNEELDALTVTGIDPVRYLVVPKLYAVTFTQPMLSLMATVVSIFGGFIIAVTYLQLGPDQYIERTLQVISFNDLANCLFKSVIFGWIVVLVGAYQGFQVERGAEGVGKAATRAVVVSIFAIIFSDGIITTVDTLSK